MRRHGFRVTLLLVALLLALGLVVYRAQSAGAPAGRGMMAGLRGMMTAQDETMSAENWAQMKAMMPAMHGLMDDLMAAPDEATAAPIRQQLLAMMGVMRGWMDGGVTLPDAEAMLARMEELWPAMGPMMTAMCDRMSDAEEPPDAEAMAAMMSHMMGTR